MNLCDLNELISLLIDRKEQVCAELIGFKICFLVYTLEKKKFLTLIPDQKLSWNFLLNLKIILNSFLQTETVVDNSSKV